MVQVTYQKLSVFLVYISINVYIFVIYQPQPNLYAETGEVKSKGERERYIQLNAEFQRTAWTDKKTFLNEQCLRPEENNRRVKSRDLFMKMEISREHFAQGWAQKKTEMVET